MIRKNIQNYINQLVNQEEKIEKLHHQRHLIIESLMSNGLEAMESGRKLVLRTFVEGEEVVLAVHDEGTGISPVALKKLGTPFFTTKETGTGLGLATCYSIAARHNANIEVNTNSQGTEFLVRFKKN